MIEVIDCQSMNNLAVVTIATFFYHWHRSLLGLYGHCNPKHYGKTGDRKIEILDS
jgi:hypothetical protein